MSEVKRKVLKLARKDEDEALKLDLPRTCENCRFSHQGEEQMYCRRLSPNIKGFPKVTPDTWCGAYKVKINRKVEKELVEGVDVISPLS